MEVRASFADTSGSAIGTNWTRFNKDTTEASTVEFTTGSSLSVTYVTPDYTSVGLSSQIGAGGNAGTGDASWVDGNASSEWWRLTSTWHDAQWEGLDPAKIYGIEVYGLASSGSGRMLETRVNSGAIDSIDVASNFTEVTQHLNISPDNSGVILVEMRAPADDAGMNAIRIYEMVNTDPAVTTTDTLQPGTEFTLTATNFASPPVSPVTLTDSAGNTITVPVTISGSGPYTAVGTMPTIAEAVTAGTSLLFGDVTIELST